MRWMRVGILSAVLVAAHVACGGSATEGSGTGVVRGVDAAHATVTLEHGDIPGVMKAMTMTFEVTDRELLEGVDVGEEVDFHVRYADGKYTVTEIDSR